jgi:hypothetical protein
LALAGQSLDVTGRFSFGGAVTDAVCLPVLAAALPELGGRMRDAVGAVPRLASHNVDDLDVLLAGGAHIENLWNVGHRPW